MNRTDRLYALVEELRAVSPRPRSARWLADRFEVSSRTIERDISALLQAGVPVWAEPGRTGGYCLDRSRTLPPVNLTPGEAVAMAVALRGMEGTPFRATAAAALRKLVAAMGEDDAAAAHDMAGRVHLLGPVDAPAPARGPRGVRTRCPPAASCASSTATAKAPPRRGTSSRSDTSARRATGTCSPGAGCGTPCEPSAPTGSSPSTSRPRCRSRGSCGVRTSTSRTASCTSSR
ncbi:HTH domain-containing protein [Streptomyces sp. NBC_00304]